jgi:hypothetical protein
LEAEAVGNKAVGDEAASKSEQAGQQGREVLASILVRPKSFDICFDFAFK